MSQVALGQQLGVSRQTVIAIEAGRYDPSLPLAIAIARQFASTVEEIFHVDKLDLRGGATSVTVLCVLFAAAYLPIRLVRHDAWLTIAAPVVMLGYAAFLLAFRSRSEPVSLLGGTQGDERQVVLRAAAITGNVLVVAVVAGFFWASAAGNDSVANVLALFGAIGGVSFGTAVAWYARHA